MTGHRIRLPAGTRIKDGRLVKAQPRSVSDKIRKRKSTRVRVQKRNT